ncbi:unnamed protein product [Ectocarpus sp. 4 AP-2014]
MLHAGARATKEHFHYFASNNLGDTMHHLEAHSSVRGASAVAPELAAFLEVITKQRVRGSTDEQRVRRKRREAATIRAALGDSRRSVGPVGPLPSAIKRNQRRRILALPRFPPRLLKIARSDGVPERRARTRPWGDAPLHGSASDHALPRVLWGNAAFRGGGDVAPRPPSQPIGLPPSAVPNHVRASTFPVALPAVPCGCPVKRCLAATLRLGWRQAHEPNDQNCSGGAWRVARACRRRYPLARPCSTRSWQQGRRRGTPSWVQGYAQSRMSGRLLCDQNRRRQACRRTEEHQAAVQVVMWRNRATYFAGSLPETSSTCC